MNKALSRVLAKAFAPTLPTTSGWLTLSGPREPVTIRRDAFGVPHVRAESDHDAWFGLGFCQGQDRAFQLELRLRTVRGTLSELIGKPGLAIDRLSRRIGFRQASMLQEQALDPDVTAQLQAFVEGINAALAGGSPRPQPEFHLTRSRPTAWEIADVIGMGKLMSFLLIGNWDVELARLKILIEDGPQALRDLNPSYSPYLPMAAPPGKAAGPALDRLSEDLAAFLARTGMGGGSNAWSVAGQRSRSGRPILANDPHLDPALPPHWYLAQVRTPDWSLTGATLIGSPAFCSGHNGFAAWGITAGLADTTDLFLEEVGPDGASVRQGAAMVPCEVRLETIRIRGAASIREEVLVTPRGPIISPALQGNLPAISLSAVWLKPAPARGFLQLQRVRSLQEFREQFNQWPLLSQNVCYADADGNIAWQLVGELPQRKRGWGTLPQPGWEVGGGWQPETVLFRDMPYATNPADGIVVSANNQPLADGPGPYLGVDWLDGYRASRIFEVLRGSEAWDIASTQSLQMDMVSPAWSEIQGTIASLSVRKPDARLGQSLLKDWDGRIDSASVPATLYEILVAAIWRRVAQNRAPKAWRWALGEGFSELLPLTTFALGRTSHLLRSIRSQPDGWFEEGWPAVLENALAEAVTELRSRRGPDPEAWHWGEVRQLTLQHPLGRIKPLAPIFNRGPFAWGGDCSTISQAGVTPLDPTGNPLAIAALRTVIEVGSWDDARFSLPGGQSGNPFSRHYDDLLAGWLEGGAISIPSSEGAVAQTTKETLQLLPLRS